MLCSGATLLYMIKKIIRRLLWIIATPLVVIFLLLGYLGLIPGVSAWFGADQPVDLGATYSEADRVRANEKFDQEFVKLDSGAETVRIMREAGANQIDAKLTGKEVAAHIEETHPVSDVQVVFHDDGTFEASGKIKKSRITSFLRTLGIDSIDQAGILAAIDKYLPGNPTFYLRGTGSVVDEKPTLALREAKIGRLPMATGPFASGLTAYAEAVLEQVPGFDIASLAIENESLHYQGTAPSIVPVY